MLAVVGFLLVSAIAFAVVWVLGRSEPAGEVNHPWNLAEAASRQVTILGGLGGFTVTAIVLLVTLGRSQPDVDPAQFDAVLVLFLVAWVSIIGTAVMLSRPPTKEGVDPLLLRLHYAVSNDQHFRSIVIGWLAMVPLLLTFDLTRPAEIFALVVGLTALGGLTLSLVVLRRLGFLGLRDVATIPLACLGGAVGWSVVVGLVPALKAAEATLHLAATAVVVNMVAFLVPAVAPILLDRGSLSLFERHGRMLMTLDGIVTTTLLAFLWLAVAGLL